MCTSKALLFTHKPSQCPKGPVLPAHRGFYLQRWYFPFALHTALNTPCFERFQTKNSRFFLSSIPAFRRRDHFVCITTVTPASYPSLPPPPPLHLLLLLPFSSPIPPPPPPPILLLLLLLLPQVSCDRPGSDGELPHENGHGGDCKDAGETVGKQSRMEEGFRVEEGTLSNL